VNARPYKIYAYEIHVSAKCIPIRCIVEGRNVKSMAKGRVESLSHR